MQWTSDLILPRNKKLKRYMYVLPQKQKHDFFCHTSTLQTEVQTTNKNSGNFQELKNQGHIMTLP